MRTCTIDGCTRKHVAKGLCASHYNRANYTPEQRHPKVSLPCHVCDTLKLKHRVTPGRRVVCSDECRYVLTYGPRKSTDIVGPMPRTCSLPAPAKAPAPTVRFVGVRCDWCDARFVHDLRVTGLVPRFCTNRCARGFHKAARRARQGRFAISPTERHAIYERDGWVCQLCHAPVDPLLPSAHRWAATLDHIECQSWALIADHSVSNLRLAHRMCNSIRGDRRGISPAA